MVKFELYRKFEFEPGRFELEAILKVYWDEYKPFGIKEATYTWYRTTAT